MLKILAQKKPWGRGVELNVIRTDTNKSFLATDLVFQEITEDMQGIIYSPTLSISMTEAQVLIDSLWDCGLRPSEGSGSAGQLDATQKHLEDMRTLVFKK